MNEVKYLVQPGYVKSISDGDIHYIGADTLIRLYGLKRSQCIVEKDDSSWRNGYTNEYLNSLIRVRPVQDGNYTLNNLLNEMERK